MPRVALPGSRRRAAMLPISGLLLLPVLPARAFRTVRAHFLAVRRYSVGAPGRPRERLEGGGIELLALLVSCAGHIGLAETFHLRAGSRT